MAERAGWPDCDVFVPSGQFKVWAGGDVTEKCGAVLERTQRDGRGKEFTERAVCGQPRDEHADASAEATHLVVAGPPISARDQRPRWLAYPRAEVEAAAKATGKAPQQVTRDDLMLVAATRGSETVGARMRAKHEGAAEALIAEGAALVEAEEGDV